MNLMLLCAGQGTRFNPYTLKRPKPAIPMLGVPMLYWSLDHALELKPHNIVCNVSHLAGQVESLIEVAALRLQHEIKISTEHPLPYESGGGLRHAKHLLNLHEDILLCNADEVTLFTQPDTLKNFAAFHKQSNSFATLLTMANPLVGSKFGGVWSTENVVNGFGRTPMPNSEGWHYIGVMMLKPEIFKYLPDKTTSNIIYDGLVAALANGEQIMHFPVEANWYETGNLQDYLEATRSLSAELFKNSENGKFITGLRNRWLGSSSTFLYAKDGNRVICEEPITEAQLAMFTGNNVVGRNCHFDTHVKIDNSVICSGASIHENVSGDLIL